MAGKAKAFKGSDKPEQLRIARVERATNAARADDGQFLAAKKHEGCEESEKRDERKKNRTTSTCLPIPHDYPWGKKRWLKRREITWEYGMCSRTIRRVELDGHLNPCVLRGEYLYLREEIEQAIESNRLRVDLQFQRNAPPLASR